MRLKAIELYGFKSFADRIRLDYGFGLSGIVGPNGTGKSNIIDAIKWVMGAQSLKELRGGDKKEDVIFFGSNSRKPMTMASVQLFIDNSDKYLPLDFGEITICRKVYRSGESEYYINDEQVRLKDIHELFMDTGLGVEAYCLIEQGKVNRIIETGKSERRQIIEEAAGVTKYKNKREEALRKLEKANENIVRIHDIVNELSCRREILDKEVKRINQYSNYKEKLIKLELSRFAYEYRVHSSALEENGRKLARVNADLEKYSDELRVAETNSGFKKNEIDDLSSRMSDNDRKIYRLNADIIRAEEKEIALKKEFDRIEKANADLTGQIKFYEARLSELAARKASLDEELKKNSLEMEGHSGQFDAESSKNKEAEEKFNAEKEKLSHSEMEMESAKRKIREDENEIIKNIEKKESLTAQGLKNRAAWDALKNELSELEDKRRALEAEFTANKYKLEALHSELNNFLNKKNELDSGISSIRATEQKLVNEIFSLDAGIRALENIKLDQSGIYAGERALCAEKDGVNLLGMLGELVRTAPGNEKLAEAMLGDRLNYLVARDEAAARERIGRLISGNSGYARMLVLSRAGDGVLPESLNRIFEGTPEEIKKLLASIFSGARVEEGILESGIYISGGVPEERGGVIETESKIEENRKRIAELNKDKASALSGLSEMSGSLLETENRTAALRNEIISAEGQIRRKEISLAMLGGETEIKRSLIGKNEDEISRIENEIKTVEEGLLAIRDNRSRAQDIAKELETIIAEKVKNFETARKEWYETSLRYNDIRAYRETLQARIDEAKKAIEASAKETAYINENISNMKLSIASNEEYVKNNSVFLGQGQTIIGEKKTEISGVEDANAKMVEEKKALSVEISKFADSMKFYNHKLSECQTDEMQCEVEIGKYRQSIDDLKKRVSEDFSSEIESIIPPEEQVEEESLRRIKKILENFGALNMQAKDEYIELENRLGFLTKQQADLDQSVNNLNETIKMLNETIQTQFMTAFLKIKLNFNEIFVKLFEGGSADISLSEDQDLLEMGVDIVAAPPGKKVKAIDQLSGGEKALTAIAFLFAIFFVKPSPFYILDEVDAPLDDANILRFLHMVREYSSRSQFILISHNKKTMEYCDVLYGVTLEEPGVSKILSVKLR